MASTSSSSSQTDPDQVAAASTSAATLIDPQNLVCDNDPKPGPSTSAADFDLEVFDSGSSCSMEEYLGISDTKAPKRVGGKSKSKRGAPLTSGAPTHAPPASSGSASASEHRDCCDVQTTTGSSSGGVKFEEPDSACVSEASEGEDDEGRKEAIDFIQMLPPSDVRSTVENWRCDNTDEIVQDHDNFGTDENEDSMDYPTVDLALPPSATTPPQSLPPPPSAQDESTQSSFELDLPAAEMDWSSTNKRKSQLVEESADDVPLKKPCILRPLPPPRPSEGGETRSKLIPDKDNPPPEILDWVSTFARWSHAQRLLAIDQLIDTCEPTQVRHMMQVIEPQFQRDFISLLPKELALFVLSYLDPKDLLRAAQTCRYWRILAEDNLLWREKCREAGVEDAADVLRKRISSGFQYSSWKASYMRQQNILMNWRVRPIRAPKVLKGHDDHVITCLQFNGQRIVSGSDDNTLKVWSALTGKCLRTLVGHTGGVWSSQMAGNVIVSGSTDRTLKVWDAETGQCVHTLYGHTSTVRCMHLHGNRVVSGSRDATLRMWDIETGECLHVLSGHVAAVRCVQYDGRLVVSGAYDYMVKVWNPEKEECLHTLSGHTNRVYSLQFDGIHVVSGSLDTSIRVWDVESGACKHALMGHQSLTSGMELRNNILVSGNADSTVKVWDITTGQCLQTLSGINKHQSAVTCLQFNSNFVITSSDDGTVKLWDVKTGEFLRDLVSLDSGGSGGVVWRIRANSTKLVCAVGSRNGTEETKLLVLDFDAEIN